MLVEHKGTDGRDTTIEHLNIEKKSLEKDVHILRQELTSAQSSLNVAIRNKDEIEKETFLLKKQVFWSLKRTLSRLCACSGSQKFNLCSGPEQSQFLRFYAAKCRR